jgi:KaiC/GvpD/RAD55 family RecA-like ATPase
VRDPVTEPSTSLITLPASMRASNLTVAETISVNDIPRSDFSPTVGPKYTKTGIPGFDELLGGGIPTGRAVLVLGEPGAGKTTLCSLFLANGYSKFGEKGVYVSLEENKIHLYREMARCGIDFAGAEVNKQFVFVDASPIRHTPNFLKTGNITIGKKEFSLVALMDSIKRSIALVDAKRVVIDPLSYLVFQYTTSVELRGALLDLMEGLTELNATVLMASELQDSGSIVRRRIQMEEYVAHGTIIMQTANVGTSLQRVIQVQKMRECDADRQPRPYRLSKDGIHIYPKESVL